MSRVVTMLMVLVLVRNIPPTRSEDLVMFFLYHGSGEESCQIIHRRLDIELHAALKHVRDVKE